MSKDAVYDELRRKAVEALSKPAPYGVDVDVEQFINYTPKRRVTILSERKRVEQVGIDISSKTRSAYFYQVDSKIEAYRSLVSGVEILPLKQAVEERWDEVRKYLWKLIPVDTDKYTAITFLKSSGGCYIRVKKNTRVELPIQTCFLLSGGTQFVHNIVVVEEGAEATIVTGCTIAPEEMGLHVGVTEIYLEQRAKLVDVMIHSWNRVTHVRPRTAVVLDDGAVYASYYINMSLTRSLQSLPKMYARGVNSRVYSATIVLGLGESVHDIGSVAKLSGEHSHAELISKVVARDRSKITARLHISSSAPKTSGYVECRGLLLSETSSITTIPELVASHSDAELFHEASIGKLRDDEIEYLMIKGFSYEEAISMLIRGFVNIELKYLPPQVEKAIQSVLDVLAKKSV